MRRAPLFPSSSVRDPHRPSDAVHAHGAWRRLFPCSIDAHRPAPGGHRLHAQIPHSSRGSPTVSAGIRAPSATRLERDKNVGSRQTRRPRHPTKDPVPQHRRPPTIVRDHDPERLDRGAPWRMGMPLIPSSRDERNAPGCASRTAESSPRNNRRSSHRRPKRSITEQSRPCVDDAARVRRRRPSMQGTVRPSSCGASGGRPCAITVYSLSRWR